MHFCFFCAKHCKQPIKQIENEYSISDNDYDNIKRIISLAGSTFEKAARTFSKFNEEELRDVILSHLNTHYLGLATAETFSKNGKTDIHIHFENKAAFIAECKIWHGGKEFNEAIEQLFSYTTWRDVKTSIIIFNRNNKDFISMLDKVEAALKNHINCYEHAKTSKNEWLCKFKKDKDDMNYICVQVIVFDLLI